MAYDLNSKYHVLKNGCERVTSDYGNRMFTCNGKTYNDFHTGLDMISSKYGVDYIVSFADGTVTDIRDTIDGYTEKEASGNYIYIDHGDGWSTRYLHIKKGSMMVRKNEKVVKGQVIGYMGSTGFSTGSHIHFEIKYNGNNQSPKEFLLGSKKFEKQPEQIDVINQTEYNVGDNVKFTGILYRDSYGNSPGQFRTNLDATIYLKVLGRKCPYNINNGLGWVTSDSLKPAEKSDYEDYIVISGDTLWKIAQKYYNKGNSYVKIAKTNNIEPPYLIYPGQKLRIPK